VAARRARAYLAPYTLTDCMTATIQYIPAIMFHILPAP